MSEIPKCPNYLENKGCERSELVLAGDTQHYWSFICRTCHLHWVVSKPVGREKARYENYIKRLQLATQNDKAEAQRPKSFHAPRGGWT